MTGDFPPRGELDLLTHRSRNLGMNLLTASGAGSLKDEDSRHSSVRQPLDLGQASVYPFGGAVHEKKASRGHRKTRNELILRLTDDLCTDYPQL